jgi:hypothetical protein
MRDPDGHPRALEQPVQRCEEEPVERLRVGRRNSWDEAVGPGVEEGPREVVALVHERRRDVAALVQEHGQTWERRHRGEDEVRAAPQDATRVLTG